MHHHDIAEALILMNNLSRGKDHKCPRLIMAENSSQIARGWPNDQLVHNMERSLLSTTESTASCHFDSDCSYTAQTLKADGFLDELTGNVCFHAFKSKHKKQK